MPLDGEPMKDKSDDDLNGIPMKGIVPYGDDIDGEPCLFLLLILIDVYSKLVLEYSLLF